MIHSPIKINAGKLKQVKYSEYVIRFLLGGVITVLTGFIAQHYGPGVGGLFLAFPAILPAAATLIAKHERERKASKGLHGEKLALDAAALDTNGAALGSIGLLGFAAVAWWLLPRLAPALGLLIATTTWLTLSLTAWLLRRYLRRARKA